MTFVRSSKFRHVFGSETKADACFNGLKTEGTSDTSLAASSKFFAMIKLTKIFIIPIDKPGRLEENSLPYLDCKTKVLDLAWSPFNDCLLASSEDSGDINVWLVDENGLNDTTCEHFWELHLHHKKVTTLLWHPTASNILAAGGFDDFISIWDCEALNCIQQLPVGEPPANFAWNRDGSLMAFTTKSNKKMELSVVDPRTGEVKQTNPECYLGIKPARVIFLADGNVLTVGVDKTANRSIVIWDKKDINQALCSVDIGMGSQNPIPYYDPELSLLYTFAKGEAVIRYFEIDDAKQIHFLNSYQGKQSQKGGNFLPKRALDPKLNEIARFFKLQANKCEPISFIVPRKSDVFQDDIYPDCSSGDPALTAEEWISGKNADPLKHSFSGNCGQPTTKAAKPVARKMLPKKESHGGAGEEPAQAQPVSLSSRHQPSNNGIPEGIDFAELMEDMKKVKATVRKLNKRVTKLEEQLESAGIRPGGEEEE